MNYIGAKTKLLPFIEKIILENIDDNCRIFCDIFSGTGVVGLNFKKLGFKIIANDLQYYSYVLNRHFIGNHKKPEFKELVKFLNKQCQDLKLNIVCTTHSLEIIKECIENEDIKNHIIINFLDKTYGKLTCKNLSTFEDISKNLLVLPRNNEKENLLKIKIFTEDLEGEWLLKKIINKDFEEYIDIVPLGLGFDEIAKVAYKLSEIKEGIVIYDAEV